MAGQERTGQYMGRAGTVAGAGQDRTIHGQGRAWTGVGTGQDRARHVQGRAGTGQDMGRAEQDKRVRETINVTVRKKPKMCQRALQ